MQVIDIKGLKHKLKEKINCIIVKVVRQWKPQFLQGLHVNDLWFNFWTHKLRNFLVLGFV